MADSEWIDEAELDAREDAWVAQIILGARERIAFGWVQGTETADLNGDPIGADESSQFCILGAVKSSTRALHHDTYSQRRALKSIAREIGSDVDARSAITRFNDDATRAKDDVLHVLDRAAHRVLKAQRATATRSPSRRF